MQVQPTEPGMAAFAEEVAAILELVHHRRFSEARQRTRELVATCPSGDKDTAEACGRLADWRQAAHEGRPGDGLVEAVAAVSRLSEAGLRGKIGRFYANIGFSLGLTGDLESGLEWCEKGAEDALRRDDRSSLITAYDNMGVLLGFAGDLDRAAELFNRVVALCRDAPEVAGVMALSNLAYCRILQANAEPEGGSALERLAREAVEKADAALAAADAVREGDPLELAIARANALSNRGSALRLLGRAAEAEEAFRRGLSLPVANAQVKVELMVRLAGLQMDGGRLAEAGAMLDEAGAKVQAGLIDQAADMVLAERIRLARALGRPDEAARLWEERFQLSQRRYADRLRNVRRYADLFAELKQARLSEREAREQAEALRISEERHRLLADNARDVIWTMQADGTITYVSPAVEKLRGVTPAEAMRQTLEEIHPPSSRAVSLDYFTRLRADLAAGRAPEPFRGELEYWCKDGSTVWTEVLAYPILGSDGRLAEIVGMSRDITERKRYQQQLEEQVRERTAALGEALFASQSAERVKDALLRNASHELRTPLNQIMGGVDLLARRSRDPAEDKWLDMIRGASRDMLRLVNELLDVARLEGGTVQLESKEFSPASVLEQVQLALSPRAAKKGIALRVEAAASLPERVVGDPTRLAQALLNYADNAIKFTEKGSVTLAAWRIDSGDKAALLHFEVRDTGIGIPADRQDDALFTAFMQLDATTTRKHGGLGIGLANVSEIAKLMGGKVGVSSSPGKGSTFWLMVPFQLP